MNPTIHQTARHYLQKGYAITPIAPGTKRPVRPNWTGERISEAEMKNYFSHDQGIGLILGRASGGLTDVDLDCPEAVRIGERFLPLTEMVHGRTSNPHSHFWYTCDPCPKYRRFEDVDGACLLEVRADGHQTVVPPSVNPSGEELSWYRDGDPSTQPASEVEVAAERLAAACLLARHWPHKGSRNEAALALSGVLLSHLGWGVDEAEKFMGALADAANDDEQQSRIITVSSTKKKLDSIDPVTGLPKLKELVGEDVVQRAWQWLGGDEESEIIESPTGDQQPWPDPLGMNASYGIVGQIVTKLEPHTEADPAALHLQTLVALGNLIGRNAYLPVEADRHHCNLFCVIVGISSKGRKGTSLGHVRRILSEVEQDSAKRLHTGLSSGEGLIWAVRDPIWQKKAIRKPGKPTEEQVVLVDSGVEDKRCLVNEQEFVSVLEVMRREGNTLSAVLRDAWDRGDLSSMTKNSAARATNAHISIIAHITRDELIQRLDGIAMKNGLANRFLWVVVKRSKFLPFGGVVGMHLDKVVMNLKKVRKFCSRPFVVAWRDDAAEKWRKIYADLSRDRQGAAGEATSRAEAQVVRLATLYALLDCSEQIKPPHLNAALEIWRYCEQSALYIFGNSSGNRIADIILRDLRNHPEGMRRTYINYILGHNLHSRDISSALGLLLAERLAVCVKKKKPTAGRPEEGVCTDFATRIKVQDLRADE